MCIKYNTVSIIVYYLENRGMVSLSVCVYLLANGDEAARQPLPLVHLHMLYV